MLQMCLLASKGVSRQALLLHNLSEEATGRRKEVEFLCWAPYHLLLLTGKNSVHGELTPMYFMLHCLASPRFHPSMEMAWRGHTCQEQLVHPCISAENKWVMANVGPNLVSLLEQKNISLVCGNDLVNVFFHQARGLI